MSFALLALSAAAGLAAATTSATPKLTADCVDTVIFFARGNDAPYHDDRTTPFLDASIAKLKAEGKTADYIDIEFDVTLGGPYCTQVGSGGASGISQVTAFQAKCPCSHIVLAGYSEGANVVGDVLAAPTACTAGNGISRTSAAGRAIAAGLFWGDPRHSANQVYNVGTGSSMEAATRTAAELARLNAYSSVLRNNCQAGDPICAGGNNVTEHLNYFTIDTDAASSWVVGKINAAADLCPASSSSSSVVSSTAAPSTSSVSSSTVAVTTSSAVSSSVATEAPSTSSTLYPIGNSSTISTGSGYSTTLSTVTSVATPVPSDSYPGAPPPPASYPPHSYPANKPSAPHPEPPKPTYGADEPDAPQPDTPMVPAPAPTYPPHLGGGPSAPAACKVVTKTVYV